VVVQDEREYSKYPPVNALIIALFLKFGRAGLANIAVTLLSFLLFLWVARLLSGGWAVPLLAAIPFLFSTTTIFHAASYFSHPAAMLLILATVAAVVAGDRSTDRLLRRRWALCAGACVGLLMLTRSFDAALTVGALVLYRLPDLWRDWRERSWYLPGMVMGMVLFLGYQRLYTGSFFLSPYRVYDASGEVLAELTLTAGQLFGRGLGEIAIFWFGKQASWSSAAVMALAVLYFLSRLARVRRTEWFVLLLPLTFMVGYALHPSMGGDSFGARYYYPVFWCWCYGAAALIHYLARRSPGVRGPLLYLLFLLVVIVPFRGQMEEKCRTVGASVDARFSFYGDIERQIPEGERAVVLLRGTPAYDPTFYVRNDPSLEERILYGRMVPRFTGLQGLESALPGRIFYWYGHDRATGRGYLERMSR
jgi:hypothetical protein